MPLKEGQDGYIHTFTGKKFYPLDPRLEDIDIRDIAHGLALQCRFGGQCDSLYSVAQHSVHVAEIVWDRALRFYDDERIAASHAFGGLMHDASEAYLGDIPSPIKHSAGFSAYRIAEDVLMFLVAEKFDFSWPPSDFVKLADKLMLNAEARDIFPGPVSVGWADLSMADKRRVNPLSNERSEDIFLAAFDRYQEMR